MRTIHRQPGVVILRSELTKLGGRSQLTRVLATLVAARKLVRVGHGIYVKTRKNKFTGTLMPAAPFETVAAEALKKLGIEVTPGTLAAEYNVGRTTQIPVLPVVNTGRRRISRRIQVGRKTLLYESAEVTRRKSHKADEHKGSAMNNEQRSNGANTVAFTQVAVYLGDGGGDSLFLVCDAVSDMQAVSVWQRALDALARPSPRGPYPVSQAFMIFVHDIVTNKTGKQESSTTYHLAVSCTGQLALANLERAESDKPFAVVPYLIGDDVITTARQVLAHAV